MSQVFSYLHDLSLWLIHMDDPHMDLDHLKAARIAHLEFSL